MVRQECCYQADSEQCLVRDGGRPAGTGLQELVSNHHKLHRLNAVVVSIMEKAAKAVR